VPFPLQLGGRTVATPAALGQIAQRDAAHGGAVAGERVAGWASGLVRDGALTAREGLGLTAALLRHPEAATVSEGARLAVALADREAGALLLLALEGHDVGLLLAPDPGDLGRSVEDALIRSAAAVSELSDADARARLLDRARHAGLAVEEARILARWGTADEIARALPGLLTEGWPAAALPDAAARVAGGGAAAAVLAPVVAAAPAR
jgi:hypothetical protein